MQNKWGAKVIDETCTQPITCMPNLCGESVWLLRARGHQKEGSWILPINLRAWVKATGGPNSQTPCWVRNQHKQSGGGGRTTLENKEVLGKNRLNPEAHSDENNLDFDTHERRPSGQVHTKALGVFFPHDKATFGPHWQELCFAKKPTTLLLTTSIFTICKT